VEVLSFKTIFLPIVIIIFLGGCTKVFDKDRVLNVQFYDTQRAINGDVFIWATYLNRIKSDKRYGDGDYFVVGYYYDKYNKDISLRLSNISPIVTMSKRYPIKIEKISSKDKAIKRLPYVSNHSVQYLVKFQKTDNADKTLNIILGDYRQKLYITLDD